MRYEFMGLASEVPLDWSDETTVTFTIPAVDIEGEPVSPGNLVINWAESAGTDASTYLEQLKIELAQAFNAFEVLEEGEAEPGLPFVRFRFAAGRDLQQILYVRVFGERAVICTGTAMTEYFTDLRERFDDVARSIEAL